MNPRVRAPAIQFPSIICRVEPWRIERRQDVALLTNGVRSYTMRADGRLGLAEITRTLESTWMLTLEGRTYEVDGGALVAAGPTGKEVFRRPLPLPSIMEQWRKESVPAIVGHDGKPTYPTHMDREPWHLTLDRAHRTLLASTRNMPAAVVAATPEGEMKWAAFLGGACCNFACVAGPGTILHASGCGRRLTVLSPHGQVVRRIDLDYNPVLFLPDAPDGAVAAAFDRVVAFDAKGEVRWKHPGN